MRRGKLEIKMIEETYYVINHETKKMYRLRYRRGMC